MISDVAQCGPCMLVPAGLVAVGGLLMGLGAVKGKKGKPLTLETGLILLGAFCVLLGFLLSAYADIERCRPVFPLGVCMFWRMLVVEVLLVILAAFLYSKRQAVCALGLSLRTRIAGLLNFIERWFRNCLKKVRELLKKLEGRRK